MKIAADSDRCRPARAIAWGFLLWFAVEPTLAQDVDDAQPRFEVTIGDETFSPFLRFAGGEGAAAHYLIDLGIPVAVDARSDRKLTLERRGEGRELLILVSPGRPPQVVGAEVRKNYAGQNSDAVLVNPLDSLSDAEIYGLWGLSLNHWSDDIAEQVQRIHPARVCMTIREDAAIGPRRSLPPLPAELAILRIDARSSEGLKDLSGLRNLKKLKSLSIDLTSSAPFDCSLLQNATELEALDLSGNELTNTESLSRLTRLKAFKASSCRELTDISFAAAMPELVVVILSHTRISDLSPLNGLPRLRQVAANMTLVDKLPETLPSLRELDIVGGRLADDAVASFQRAHPHCRVRHRWEHSLRTALKPATRLRVRSGGTCHRDEAAERTLFETADAAEIEQLLAGVRIIEERSGGHCLCCGEPSLEFYSEDQMLLTIGFHHGELLRWSDGWPGDAALTRQSSEFLIEWLANRGVLGPLKERQSKEEAARAVERRIERATTGMSPALANAFRGTTDAFRAALVEEVPDESAQIQVWLRILAARNDNWSAYDGIDFAAQRELAKYDTEILFAAVEQALTGADRPARRGAVRYWTSWKSPLQEWKPPDIARLHRIVIHVEQEARHEDIRLSALDRVRRWKDELSEDEFDRCLSAGLHDPAPQVRRKAMLVAGQTKHFAAAPLLLKVLRGEVLDRRPLPAVPETETQDVSAGFFEICPGAADAEVAALALGYLQHAQAKSLIEALPPTPVTDVALALLGEGDRLKPEHFATEERNQELQLAAVGAVIGFKGRFGLEYAINYRQATHWWEESFVAAALSRMLVSENAPGSELLLDCEKLKVLQQWHADHGAEYLKSLEPMR